MVAFIVIHVVPVSYTHLLGIVMGLSFLSLLYLQVSYIEEMVKMRKGQFDESVPVSYTHLWGVKT